MGQERILSGRAAVLERVFAAGRAAHAYLFLGPASPEKEETVRHLARILLCLEKKERPCFACRSCQLFTRGKHPDFHVVAPEGDKIKLEEIRTVCREAAYHPSLAETKIYFFPAFDRMTEVAANAFLKTLEEPPLGVVFLALAENEEIILPTVLSRMQRVYLGKKTGEAPVHAAGDTLKEEELLARGDLLSLLRLAEEGEKKDRESVDQYLLSLTAVFHRRLRGNPHERKYYGFLQAVRRAREYLAAGVNLRLLLEDLYLSLYEKAGGK